MIPYLACNKRENLSQFKNKRHRSGVVDTSLEKNSGFGLHENCNG